ncbi:Piso0_002955 [Millerozyma farinosa CBS 7064]|uniref:Piso0_002955 protein n=1 Tax=Pichia sorbitophila (strain ATCC MYA-4447 / BCRC 22081 / CBS 7064 / NBRC 10061 / NRRL Y-12695) TaxID=559304 RepID=G8YJY3_PICSO|nr:Piso0_002955 [Millerozyma farinosa CBS 7064]CCE80628.1 Piso0_002955 [Millerozyma farinosa CBS 7064]
MDSGTIEFKYNTDKLSTFSGNGIREEIEPENAQHKNSLASKKDNINMNEEKEIYREENKQQENASDSVSGRDAVPHKRPREEVDAGLRARDAADTSEEGRIENNTPLKAPVPNVDAVEPRSSSQDSIVSRPSTGISEENGKSQTQKPSDATWNSFPTTSQTEEALVRLQEYENIVWSKASSSATVDESWLQDLRTVCDRLHFLKETYKAAQSIKRARVSHGGDSSSSRHLSLENTLTPLPSDEDSILGNHTQQGSSQHDDDDSSAASNSEAPDKPMARSRNLYSSS